MAGIDFHADPQALFDVSVKFQDHRLWANQILQALAGQFADSSGMAGADLAGQSFGRRYDAAAGSVALGLSRVGVGMGQIGLGLLGMVDNYLAADAASNAFDPHVPLPRSAADCEPVRVSLPSAIGENHPDVVSALAPFWPQGDPVRLRQAAGAWQDAAVAIGSLGAATDVTAGAAYRSGSGPALDASNENQRPPIVYQSIMSQQTDELARYGSVMQDPGNHARFVEIETNDPLASRYFQTLLTLEQVRGKARYVP